MVEKAPIFVDPKKRAKNFSRLILEEADVLKSSNDSEHIAKEFDRIFLKLQRLISYSNNKNNAIKSEIESHTNNIIKKFLNYLKGKALPRKISDEQGTFFHDICNFINFFDGDSRFSKIHNNIPKTTIRKFNDKSVGEQFSQISYGKEGGLNGIPEGGDCSYRTLLLYNFFNKLKEAGLDLDIKLFRYKNLDDTIVNHPAMRHSGLIVTFQGEDYFIDQEETQIDGDKEPIVRELQSYIDIAKEEKNENDEKFFENFKHENMKETDQVIFFDNVDGLISHIEKYPPYKRISFYLPCGQSERPDKISFEFVKNGIGIAVNGHWHTYYLKDNDISRKGFPANLVDKLAFERDRNGIHPITEQDKQMFKKCFSLVCDKINADLLYNNYMIDGKWKSIPSDFMGTPKVIIMPR